jgi:hypothetical protein
MCKLEQHEEQFVELLRSLTGGISQKQIPSKLEICVNTYELMETIGNERHLTQREMISRVMIMVDIIIPVILEPAAELAMVGCEETMTLDIESRELRFFTERAEELNVDDYVLFHVCVQQLEYHLQLADEYEYERIENIQSDVRGLASNANALYNKVYDDLGYYPLVVENALIEVEGTLNELDDDIQGYLDGKGWPGDNKKPG